MSVEQYEGAAEIEVLPPERPLQAQAIAALREQQQALAMAEQMGEFYSRSELVGPAYRGKPANAAVAILYGAELGLGPLQSLQQVFVVHGMPAIYARTAIALCMRAGIKVETVSSTDDSVTVKATAPDGRVETSTWDSNRSNRAGYHTNKKYQTDPQAMHYAKAGMEVCRKIAPEVLLGIPMSREELDLDEQPTRVQSTRGGQGVAGLKAMISPGEPEQEYAEEVPTEPTPEQPEIVMATPEQLRALAQWRKREGWGDDEEGRIGWFGWLTAAVQRPGQVDPFTTNKDLTESEAGEIISMLAKAANDDQKGSK